MKGGDVAVYGATEGLSFKVIGGHRPHLDSLLALSRVPAKDLLRTRNSGAC